jgi:hypothetical protein
LVSGVRLEYVNRLSMSRSRHVSEWSAGPTGERSAPITLLCAAWLTSRQAETAAHMQVRRILVRLLQDQSTARTGRKRIRSQPRAIDTSAPVFNSSDTAERFAAGKAAC